MGRLGPLTSQGLGRSPYDDVVQGEGESDPRAPLQQYDERGRPVNPATRQKNKDIIRSHNEVMQVIGVAEPENTSSEPQVSSDARQREWEDEVGGRLLEIGRFVHESSAWGVNGVRRRILLYQTYSHIPLSQLWGYERRQWSLGAVLFAGYPALAAIRYWRGKAYEIPWRPDHPVYRPLYRGLKAWVSLHVNVFAALQQLGILSARHIIPNYKFFIPCSSVSPIPAPPPLTSFTTAEILKWTGKLALNAAPLLAFYACERFCSYAWCEMWQLVFQRLPTAFDNTPVRPKRRSQRPSLQDAPPPPETLQSTTPPQSPAPPAPPLPAHPTPENQPQLNRGGFPTTSGMWPTNQTHDQVQPQATPDGPSVSTDTQPRSAVRRHSTISAHGAVPSGGGGGEAFYASDDEDNSGDMVSTTLISFDVEATEATDPPPGQWFAELRHNVADNGRPDGSGGAHAAGCSHAPKPVYRSTMLTRLPSCLAADWLAWVPIRVIVVPLEAVTLRWLVRTYLGARGLSVAGTYPVLSWGLSWAAIANNLSLGLSWTAVANLVGVELVHFFIQCEIWAGMSQIASYFRMSEEEWSYVSGMDGSVD